MSNATSARVVIQPTTSSLQHRGAMGPQIINEISQRADWGNDLWVALHPMTRNHFANEGTPARTGVAEILDLNRSTDSLILFKSLIAGPNITFTDDTPAAGDILISATNGAISAYGYAVAVKAAQLDNNKPVIFDLGAAGNPNAGFISVPPVN